MDQRQDHAQRQKWHDSKSKLPALCMAICVHFRPMAAATGPNAYGPCPKCKVGIVRKTKLGAGCSRFKDGCTFSIWSKMYGKKLSEGHIRQLITTGRTVLIRGFKEKDGSGTYDACLAVSKEFKVKIEFELPAESE